MTSDAGVVDPVNQDALKMMRSHFTKVFKEASDQWWKGGSEVVSLPSDHANYGDGGAA